MFDTTTHLLMVQERHADLRRSGGRRSKAARRLRPWFFARIRRSTPEPSFEATPRTVTALVPPVA